MVWPQSRCSGWMYLSLLFFLMLVKYSTSQAEVVALTVNTSVTFGQGAVLVCVGYGEPSVTVTWKSNTEVTSTSRVTIIEEDLSQDGRLFLQSFLQLCSVDISHAGNYTCTVTNGSSSTSANTELTVTDAPLELVGISNTTYVEAGLFAILVCIGYGSEAVLSMSWNRGDQTISNGTYETIYEEWIEVEGRTYLQSFLQLCNVQLTKADNYICVVTDGVSSTNSNVIVNVAGFPAISNSQAIVSSTVELTVEDVASPAALIGGIMGASIPLLLVLSSVILCLGVHFWKKQRENDDDDINKVFNELKKSATQKVSPDYSKIFYKNTTT